MSEFVSGNIFVRPVHLAKVGDTLHSHCHPFDHTTIVFRGKVAIHTIYEGRDWAKKDAEAPCHFLVEAGVWHEITALVDDTLLWCVYSHRDANGGVVQKAEDAAPQSYNCDLPGTPWGFGLPPVGCSSPKDVSDRLVIHRHG